MNDDAEESIDETPRSSERSSRVVAFDENDQIVDSPSKTNGKGFVEMVDLTTTQMTTSTSTLLKQTPSYSQKKRERRHRKKEFEMAEQAEKERVKREQEQAKMLAVEKLTGAPSDGTQKKKKVQVKAKKVVLDDQG